MKLLIISLLVFGCFSSSVVAHHKTQQVNAKVIKVEPVYEYVKVRHSVRYCQPQGKRSHQLTALGGLVGGIIGHTVSDKNHKRLGTLAGAAIGGSLLHKIEHHQSKKMQNDRSNSQHCVVEHSPSKVRVLKGYHVTYRTQGKHFVTFRQNKPSKTIRISA